MGNKYSFTRPDGSGNIEGILANMLSQTETGGSVRMVEGHIPHVYRFVSHPEFQKAIARGVNVQILVTRAPENDEERKMMEEIAKYAGVVNTPPTERDRMIALMSSNMESEYKRGGVKAVAEHMHRFVRRDQKEIPYNECLTQAKQFEKSIYGNTLGYKAKQFFLGLVGKK